MTKKQAREIRCYDYVNHPYERVCNALRDNAVTVFQLATKSAVSRVRSVAAELRVEVGGVGLKADIDVRVRNVEEKSDAIASPSMRLQLEWEAATMPALFPVMKAELSVYPLTPTETQLDFLGHYEPPFGLAGRAVNAVAGYRVAEASVHRFLSDVAAHLRQAVT